MKTDQKLNKVLQYVRPPQSRHEAQRLFHGRGHAYDGLNHVTIDWLPPVILITLFKEETNQAIALLAKEILPLFPECKSIQVQHRHLLHGPIDVIHGNEINQLSIQENDLKYHIQLGKSRNTGLFLDMNNGRKWVQDNSKGKSVLNLFSYTCGFSVAALAGGARSVVNIDMSSAALSVGRKNHQLNKQSTSNVKFEKLNIFKSFGRLKKRGPFDLLICDPPTFQKGSVDIKRDYPKILRRLDAFMKAESTLMLCLNAPELGRDFLFKNMAEHAPDYQYIEEISLPNVYVDVEKKGLKILIFKR